MAALEIEGRIKLKLGRQSGQSARGGWTKQEFVLTYMDGNYPADICIAERSLTDWPAAVPPKKKENALPGSELETGLSRARTSLPKMLI